MASSSPRTFSRCELSSTPAVRAAKDAELAARGRNLNWCSHDRRLYHDENHMFFRKSAVEPLPVTMSAVRMGERVLQVGVDDAAVASAIAAKVGLSGHAAIAVADERDAARAHGAAASAGVLVDVKVAPLASLPFESDAFDLVVVHGVHGLVSSLDADARLAAMREWRGVLRQGGRVMTIER